MALRLCAQALRLPSPLGARNYIRERYGRREIVGYFLNGSPVYQDRVDMPFPAVRFKEADDQIRSLREKEKGDWKEMCLDEKKALYRASFCQTFAELQAPTGLWKNILAWVLVGTSMGCWLHMIQQATIYDSDMLPESFDEEHQRAQFERILNLEVNPVHGISSKWDYDKDDWK